MGKINYEEIYNKNRDDWKELTNNPQKYEALLAGHYSDSNHFVYELIQNAEDAKATKTVIEYYEDKLIFYHDGIPFDAADVRGVSSMLMGTKAKEDAQTIGRFGMGFKSVFKYTYQPEIYSDDEAFLIRNYLLPIEIKDGWNCSQEKREISYTSSRSMPIHPFAGSKHLTKIVIPFMKKNKNGEIEKISGDDVLIKLRELTGEILLFLNHINDLCWINKMTGEGAAISLKSDKADHNLVGCSIRKLNESKGNTTYYLKYKKVFDHKDMKSAEVSVAYKLNNRANNINDMPGTDIYVYFPTKDETDLPFLVHGSFETAVSREKLMDPSSFNSYLFDVLGDLIANSMNNLKNRKLITQNFIRRLLFVAFKDEEDKNTIPGLRDKITEVFSENEMLPGTDGQYHRCGEMFIPAPFGIAEFSRTSLFGTSLSDKKFVAFNDSKAVNFGEYYSWLKNDLGLKTYTLLDWANDLKNISKNTSFDMKDFDKFYIFLTEHKDKEKEPWLYDYQRVDQSTYDMAISSSINKAWEILRQSNIIINSQNTLSAAYKGDKEQIYLSSSSDYKRVSDIVHPIIAKKYLDLMKEDFHLSEFDDFQYVKEKVIKKYINVADVIEFENEDDSDAEYIQDIKQIIKQAENPSKAEEMSELLEEAWIMRVNGDNGNVEYARPCDSYAGSSDEGIDLSVYLKPIPYTDNDEEDDDYWEDLYNFEKYQLDINFFLKNDISIDSLKKLGLFTTLVDNGDNYGKTGNMTWQAEGDFCPDLNIYEIRENLKFIGKHPDSEIAIEKSAQILKLLLAEAHKLSGTVKYRSSNPYYKNEEARILRAVRGYKWLYCTDGKMNAPQEISKYELNEAVYGKILSDKAAYKQLGFIEKEQDVAEEAFEIVDNLDERNKKILAKHLAREFGWSFVEDDNANEEQYTNTAVYNANEIFTVNDWESNEFPSHKIRNMDSLVEHVRQQFYCADPVKYKRVWRQMRTSKSLQTSRAYALSMYTNSENNKMCQICKEPAYNPEIVEISNYGMELPQMHLCLCRNCAAVYKSMRDPDKDNFKEMIRQKICDIDTSSDEDNCFVELTPDISINFTQTHTAELQILFKLIEEYGLPNIGEAVS